MEKETKMISKTWTIGQVLAIDESFAEIFMGFGMHCLYCPMGQQETLEEASAVHDIDVELLVKKLNERKKELKK